MIREATKPSQWKYVKTKENPADQATRGLKAKNLEQTGTWFKGPNFIIRSETDWPEQLEQRNESLLNDPEIKNKTAVHTTKVKEENKPMNELINYYSDWKRLKRAVAWILKVKETLWKLKEERKRIVGATSQTEKGAEWQKTKLRQHRNTEKPLEIKNLSWKI